VNQKFNLILIITFLVLFFSCKNKNNNQSTFGENDNSSKSYRTIAEEENEDEYPDGTYCADVEYYNQSSGTRRTYKLNVEVESGELTLIHWPNNGWLDNSHFSPEDISDGECEFKSDRGYHYTVKLRDKGSCNYTDEYKIRRDINNDVEETTCKKCGDEKDSYDKYCDNCKDKIEHTCNKCGQIDNLMFSTDKYCNDCEDKLENTCSKCGSYEYGVYRGRCSSCKNKEDDEN
jgi:hypothetical protein